MAVSKEVQAAVDRIREMKNAEKADREADKLREAKISDLEQKLSAAQAKLDAIPVNRELSEEDKAALQSAFDDVVDAKDAMTETNDELKGAVIENTEKAPDSSSGSVSGGPSVQEQQAQSAQEVAEQRQRDKEAGPQPTEFQQAPLMPNVAFNPDPTGVAAAGGNDGQPTPPAAVETAGGFVVSGGGTTQRAPGSSPESPSSSQVVPLDPDAKAPASTADLVKSGLGDSTGNETIGNDLKPVDQSPGMPHEPTDAEKEAAQKQADMEAEERRRREENPLNLAPEGTPQAGSPDAEKAMREQALEDQRKGMESAKMREEENKAKMENPSSDAFADESKPNPAS